MTKPVCAIVGVGPGNGAAFARRFAREGYMVALLARSCSTTEALESELHDSKAYACDAIDAQSIDAAFAGIERDFGPISVLIYNAGSGDCSNVEQTDPAAFEAAWRINALGCLLCSQRVIPGMGKIKESNIVIIGATASLKGNAGFTSFASAKAAQRSLAQSMARHLDPQGIHVGYVIIDGVIDLPRTRQAMSNRSDEFFMNPNHIADAVHYLTTQQRSAWTFELDLRPFGEKW
ncbi:MAG TPA: SDR family NAD(P)-dependent oxidoreductase [Gammaproteobacteria bacterium]|nr:SDR family NAD(P)-dependent oxidoreductase [Gammaproteobacteria bacterium]